MGLLVGTSARTLQAACDADGVRHRPSLPIALLVFRVGSGSGRCRAGHRRRSAPPRRAGARAPYGRALESSAASTAALRDLGARRPPAGDGRRAGRRIVVVRGGAASHAVPRPPLPGALGDEQGLLSLAFAPDYARSGLVYVYYTGRDAASTSSSSAARRPTAPTPRARASCCDGRPRVEPQRRGGHFRPDRHLYIGTGDGGGGSTITGPTATRRTSRSLLGKILRIDSRPAGRPYTVPASNPFVTRARARDEIYSYGLSNPGASRSTGRTGDTQHRGRRPGSSIEEVDFVRPAARRGRELRPAYLGGDAAQLRRPAPGALRPGDRHTTRTAGAR